MTRQHCGGQGNFAKTAKSPRRQGCQEGELAKMAILPKNGDFAQEGKSAKKGNVAAVGEFAKDSNVMKKATDNITYCDALQVVS